MSKLPTDLPIMAEKARFKSYLSNGDNRRIIFSSKFGTGKTYFLKKFFDEEDIKQEYDCIKIYPVNYVVASNEDIFEYIKVDILFQLQQKVKIEDGGNYNFFDAANHYIYNNFDKVLEKLLIKVEKISFNTDIIKSLFELHKVIEKDKKQLNRGNTDEIDDFLKRFGDKVGCTYEENAITQLICFYVNRIKSGEKDNTKRKSVLVIDDLDRLDPEHIFRILNIMSAHEDYNGTEEHKFGFDSVILVCDIENIRNIFKAKYGIDTDFNGYIDKFHTKEIFQYDFRHNITKIVQIILMENDIPGVVSNYDLSIIAYLVNYFYNSGYINIRNIVQLHEKIPIKKLAVKSYNEGYLHFNSKDPQIVFFAVLSSLFSSHTDCNNAINSLNPNSFDQLSVYNIEYLNKLLFILSDYYNLINKSSKETKLNHSIHNIEYSHDRKYGLHWPDGLNITQEYYKNTAEVIKKAYENYIKIIPTNYFIEIH